MANKRSNQHLKKTGSRKLHAGEDLAPEILEIVPDVPADLEGMTYATAEWDRVCALLVEQQILTEWDLPTIRLLCFEWQRYREAVDNISLHGEFFTTKNNYEVRRPISSVRNQSYAHYSNLLKRVGADTVSRSNMKRVRPTQEKANPFGSL